MNTRTSADADAQYLRGNLSVIAVVQSMYQISIHTSLPADSGGSSQNSQ